MENIGINRKSSERPFSCQYIMHKDIIVNDAELTNTSTN